MVCFLCPNAPLCGYLGAYRNCTLSKKSCNSFEHPYYARFVNGLMFRIDRRSDYTKQAGQTVPLVLCSLCMSLKCVDYFIVFSLLLIIFRVL